MPGKEKRPESRPLLIDISGRFPFDARKPEPLDLASDQLVPQVDYLTLVFSLRFVGPSCNKALAASLQAIVQHARRLRFENILDLVLLDREINKARGDTEVFVGLHDEPEDLWIRELLAQPLGAQSRFFRSLEEAVVDRAAGYHLDTTIRMAQRRAHPPSVAVVPQVLAGRRAGKHLLECGDELRLVHLAVLNTNRRLVRIEFLGQSRSSAQQRHDRSSKHFSDHFRSFASPTHLSRILSNCKILVLYKMSSIRKIMLFGVQWRLYEAINSFYQDTP